MPGTTPAAAARASQSQTTLAPRSRSTTTTGASSPRDAAARQPAQRLEHVVRQVQREPELARRGRHGQRIARATTTATAERGPQPWPVARGGCRRSRRRRRREFGCNPRLAGPRHGQCACAGNAAVPIQPSCTVAARPPRLFRMRASRPWRVPSSAMRSTAGDGSLRVVPAAGTARRGSATAPPRAAAGAGSAGRGRLPSRAPRCRRPSATPAPLPTRPAARARRGCGSTSMPQAASAGAYGGCGGEIQASQPPSCPRRTAARAPATAGSARRCRCGP